MLNILQLQTILYFQYILQLTLSAKPVSVVMDSLV